MGIKETIIGGIKDKAIKTILDPANEILDKQLTDITTTIGTYIVRKVRGKFQRSITFSIGGNASYTNGWMEEALYGILYQYNDIKKNPRLELTNATRMYDGTGMYYRLTEGTHNLKYRKWDILLNIQTTSPPALPGTRSHAQQVYTIICYDMSPTFVTAFEQDMLVHRNSLLKIRSDKRTVTVYNDAHESDGYTYWEKLYEMNKRKLNTIYLPREQKKQLVDCINNWFSSKKFYNEHGIPHNLTILLYGPPGTGKTSITKMIASEWCRNLYECTGGKDGKFMPQCIMNIGEGVNYPLYSISDIDKYPFLINEQDIDVTGDNEKGKANDEQMKYKQIFGSMINALDGVMSGEDRIIVMTTNHIEKFSDVILRPGRVDFKMEIGYVTPEVFRQYVFDFYGKELPADIQLAQNDLTISTLQCEVVMRKMPYDEFIKLHVK